MNTLKKLVLPVVCFASLMASSSFAGTGGFLLGAPGIVTGSLVETKAPFSTTKDLGRFYKYIFRGMETGGGDGNNGAAGNSGSANGGVLNLFVEVNGDKLKEVGFDHELAYNTSEVRTFVSDEIIYREIDISVSWKANGNAKQPNGYFIILGEGIRDPKEPKGELDVKDFAMANTTFKISWKVTRDY